MDTNKVGSIHRLYGHATFMKEAEKHEKPPTFIRMICVLSKCDTPYRLKTKN